jgi:hypothetical protein
MNQNSSFVAIPNQHGMTLNRETSEVSMNMGRSPNFKKSRPKSSALNSAQNGKRLKPPSKLNSVSRLNKLASTASKSFVVNESPNGRSRKMLKSGTLRTSTAQRGILNSSHARDETVNLDLLQNQSLPDRLNEMAEEIAAHKQSLEDSISMYTDKKNNEICNQISLSNKIEAAEEERIHKYKYTKSIDCNHMMR